MLLTLDLGTSVTKATVWDERRGPVSTGRAAIETMHPAPGWAEQDPLRWWSSVVEACRDAGVTEEVEGIVFAAARSTFVPVTEEGTPLGPGLVWSDRRAAGGADDGASMLAKARWIAAHQPARWSAARWLLAPRDVMVHRLTGAVVTDPTLASRTGCHAPDGWAVAVDVEPAIVERLAPVVASATVVGAVNAPAAAALGVRVGVPVVVGAGDRACEVLGTAAQPRQPMVSWGTTANVSVPVDAGSSPPAPGVVVSAGALGGAVAECGLSGAGSAMQWLARLTGRSPLDLCDLAERVAVGAAGVLAVAWFDGARAPWWEPRARAALMELSFAHGPAELARAVLEAVACDAARSIERLCPSGLDAVGAAGAGAVGATWPAVLAGVSAAPVERRAPELAASAGALLIGARGLGRTVDLDVVNPVRDTVTAPEAARHAYARLRSRSDAACAAVLGLGRDA